MRRGGGQRGGGEGEDDLTVGRAVGRGADASPSLPGRVHGGVCLWSETASCRVEWDGALCCAECCAVRCVGVVCASRCETEKEEGRGDRSALHTPRRSEDALVPLPRPMHAQRRAASRCDASHVRVPPPRAVRAPSPS